MFIQYRVSWESMNSKSQSAGFFFPMAASNMIPLTIFSSPDVQNIFEYVTVCSIITWLSGRSTRRHSAFISPRGWSCQFKTLAAPSDHWARLESGCVKFGYSPCQCNISLDNLTPVLCRVPYRNLHSCSTWLRCSAAGDVLMHTFGTRGYGSYAWNLRIQYIKKSKNWYDIYILAVWFFERNGVLSNFQKFAREYLNFGQE